MSKSKLFFGQISKLIEQGLYNYKDLSNEFISILKSKNRHIPSERVHAKKEGIFINEKCHMTMIAFRNRTMHLSNLKIGRLPKRAPPPSESQFAERARTRSWA